MRLIIIPALLAVALHCDAVMFPVMTDVQITSCSEYRGLPCAAGVGYWGTSAVVDIGTPVTAPISRSREIQAWGVHCSQGDSATGRTFSGCQWTQAGHAPQTSNCTLVDSSSWVLTTDSTCTTERGWGTHSGAGPGGECVMFGTKLGEDLITPSGVLSAVSAANGGNRFCIKPLPPGAVCEVSLPPLIDHGWMLTGTRDTKSIVGKVQCGGSVVVTVVGLAEVILAPGVSTKISTTMDTTTDLRIQSDMTVGSSAPPGDYSASAIVAVSPW